MQQAAPLSFVGNCCILRHVLTLKSIMIGSLQANHRSCIVCSQVWDLKDLGLQATQRITQVRPFEPHVHLHAANKSSIHAWGLPLLCQAAVMMLGTSMKARVLVCQAHAGSSRILHNAH